MAIYRISYLYDDTYSTRNSCSIDEVIDEYDAVEKMINSYNMNADNLRILNVQLISE